MHIFVSLLPCYASACLMETRYVLALASCIFLLGFGINNLPGTGRLSSAWKLGLGSVSGRTVITTGLPTTGAGGLVANVLLSNVPQLISSMLYFTYNGLFTCMLSASEWNSFSNERKGLRVSRNPMGAQRSTYFLQIPYRYGGPLLILSMVLHWLISQSLFFINIKMLNANGEAETEDSISEYSSKIDRLMTCGYSPFAIFFTTLLGICLVAFVLLISRRRIRGGIPMAGSCSAAMSAACHGSRSDSEKSPLQWGAVLSARADFESESGGGNCFKGFGVSESDIPLLSMNDKSSTESDPVIGHCSFTSADVEEPQHGRLYAGSIFRHRKS